MRRKGLAPVAQNNKSQRMRAHRSHQQEEDATLDNNLSYSTNWFGSTEELTSPYSDEQDGRGRFFFTADRWLAHKSTGRYFRHMAGLFRSRTFRSIRVPLAVIGCTSSLFTLYQELATNHQLGFLVPVEVSNVLFEQSSVALSLLLVFRTDASYGRWNECLSMWGQIRTSCKELVTLASIYVKDKTRLQLIVDWTLAFATCMDLFLKPRSRASDLAARIELVTCSLCPLIGQKEAERVATSSTVPGHPWVALQVLVELIHASKLSDVNEGRLLAPLQSLMTLAGSCERILRFPIPLSWTRHTSRFLLLWLFLLPLCLYDDFNRATPIADVLISYLLLGIDDIGVQIEEPFAILPMAQIVAALRQELSDIICSQDAAKDVVTRVYETRFEMQGREKQSSSAAAFEDS